MNYFLPFLFSFFISIFLTGYFKNIGNKFGIVSKPRERDIHKKPIPRIGGVAIFISFILVLFVAELILKDKIAFGYGEWFSFDNHAFAIFLGGTLIASTMFLDDIYGLKVWQKLFLQLIAVLILISAGIGINTLTNPFGEAINLNSVYVPLFSYKGIVYNFSLWSDLLTIIWVMGMMNTINFIDGVDGLAGGVSFIALMTLFLLSISLAVSQPATAMTAIILAGSTLGFLIWNFPPAKIFMGDSGSMFLGFMLGALTLISGGKLATVFLVLGFPIIDGIAVVIGRIKRGQNPFTTPDKTHLHHRFLKAGYTPRQSVLFIYVISIIFSWVALRSTTENKIIAAVLLIIVLFLLTIFLNKKAKFANR